MGSVCRPKARNRAALDEAVARRRLYVIAPGRIAEVAPDRLHIEVEGMMKALRKDALFICIGGILPSGFLRSAGIDVVTKHADR